MSQVYSQACENNKAPILNELKRLLAQSQRVLEIGSGTGQHAVHFAPQLTQLIWQTSDLEENHESIQAWMSECNSPNLLPPVEFQVGVHCWPVANVDVVFTANTTHIMQPQEVRQMMQLVALHLPKDGLFCQYGPFRVNGKCTSPSNAEFDDALKQKGYGGLRDLKELEEWAEGLALVEKIDMPANNLLLVWRKRGQRKLHLFD